MHHIRRSIVWGGKLNSLKDSFKKIPSQSIIGFFKVNIEGHHPIFSFGVVHIIYNFLSNNNIISSSLSRIEATSKRNDNSSKRVNPLKQNLENNFIDQIAKANVPKIMDFWVLSILGMRTIKVLTLHSLEKPCITESIPDQLPNIIFNNFPIHFFFKRLETIRPWGFIFYPHEGFLDFLLSNKVS